MRSRIAASGCLPLIAVMFSIMWSTRLVAGIAQVTAGWAMMNFNRNAAQCGQSISAAQSGSGWRWADWFGYFYDSGNGWIYHMQHGWLYSVGSSDADIWLWDMQNLRQLPTVLEGHHDRVLSLAFSPDGQTLASASGQTPGTVAFGTEGHFLQSLGMETVIFGPGSIDQAHQPNEYLALEQIPPAKDILCQAINRYCLQ